MNKGFTLIETLIYIALFTIVIGGGMVAAYQIIQSSAEGTNHVILEEEANFLLRKVNWALTGATAVSVTGSRLEATKNATTYSFNLCGINLTIETGSGKTCANSPITLNSSSISVAATTLFTKTSGNGKSDSITTAFNLTTVQNGKNVTEDFSTIKYLRQ